MKTARFIAVLLATFILPSISSIAAQESLSPTEEITPQVSFSDAENDVSQPAEKGDTMSQNAVESGIVTVNKAIENGVVYVYKKIEDFFVSGYKAIENRFVQAFLASKKDPPKEQDNSD